jgi:Ser-tRNA(Ala) deacylase AlaX
VDKCQNIDGNIYHFGKYISLEKFKVSDAVEVNIDQEKRLLHARYHTAAHLLDVALLKIGYKNECIKAYSFPEGAYNEYEGQIDLNNSPNYETSKPLI